MMIEMGFLDIDANIEALHESKGDIYEAIDFLERDYNNKQDESRGNNASMSMILCKLEKSTSSSTSSNPVKGWGEQGDYINDHDKTVSISTSASISVSTFTSLPPMFSKAPPVFGSQATTTMATSSLTAQK